MYGTNVLTAPIGAERNTDPSFRIRHSRPSAGYEVPRSRLRLTARGRAVFTTLAALPIAIAMFVFALNGGGATATVDLTTSEFEYVTVMAGQTLWELAVELEPSADPRDVIHDVLQLNQLDSSAVYPGQRLAIPTAYTTNN